MFHLENPGSDRVYETAERFVDAALRTDGSLFTPSEKIWSPENIADFYDRFVSHAEETAKKFNIKLKRQLTGAPATTIQLVAELVYFHLLFSDVTKGPAKKIARRRNPLLVAEARDRTSGAERGVRVRDRRNGTRLQYDATLATRILGGLCEAMEIARSKSARKSAWRPLGVQRSR